MYHCTKISKSYTLTQKYALSENTNKLNWFWAIRIEGVLVVTSLFTFFLPHACVSSKLRTLPLTHEGLLWPTKCWNVKHNASGYIGRVHFAPAEGRKRTRGPGRLRRGQGERPDWLEEGRRRLCLGRELRAARLAVRLTDTLDASSDSSSGSPTNLTLVRFSDQLDARLAS